MIAALYVEPNGPYANLEGVDVWDEARDARTYAGPHPVVAHPPCARWSVLAGLVESLGGKPKREDEGCFAAALAAVRNYGGVLEHPASSAAWKWFGLNRPASSGGWVNADWEGGWTCCVAQRNYGHRATKRTWLYAVGFRLPSLVWGDGPSTNVRVTTHGPLSGRADRGLVEKMGHRERRITPEPFRDLLLSMARSVRQEALETDKIEA